MFWKKKKSTVGEDLEKIVTAEFIGNQALDQFNKELVDKVLSGFTKQSILDRMETLDKAGMPSGFDDAINDLAKTTKGQALEAVITGEHDGARFGGFGRPSNFGVPGGELSPTDNKIDLRLRVKNIFSGKESVTDLQAKSSFKVATDAIGKYENKIIVPTDVYEKLKNSHSPKVQEAFAKGAFVEKAGGFKGITEQEAINQAKERHLRDWNGEKLELKTFDFNAASKVALIGGGFRAGFSLSMAAYQKGKLNKEDLRRALLDGGLGMVESGGRALVAQGLSKSITTLVKGSGGRWVGRTAGAGAGLICSTVKDGYSLLKGDITLKEFGTRGLWNGALFAATSFSGPLGLGIVVTKVVVELRQENSKIRDENLRAETENIREANENYAQADENLIRIGSRIEYTKHLQMLGNKHLKKGS